MPQVERPFASRFFGALHATGQRLRVVERASTPAARLPPVKTVGPVLLMRGTIFGEPLEQPGFLVGDIEAHELAELPPLPPDWRPPPGNAPRLWDAATGQTLEHGTEGPPGGPDTEGGPPPIVDA